MPERLKKYVPYRSPDSPKPIAVHEEIQKARIAKWWNLKPWEFDLLTPDRQAKLHAIYVVENTIESYYTSEANRMAKSKEK